MREAVPLGVIERDSDLIPLGVSERDGDLGDEAVL